MEQYKNIARTTQNKDCAWQPKTYSVFSDIRERQQGNSQKGYGVATNDRS